MKLSEDVQAGRVAAVPLGEPARVPVDVSAVLAEHGRKTIPLSPLDGGDVPDETGGAGVSKLAQVADPSSELLEGGK
jgi:hypothetical protein